MTTTNTEAPPRIFLVIGEDCPRDAQWDQLEEVTWCADKIDDNSIEYVRADTARAQIDSVTRERDAALGIAADLRELCATTEHGRVAITVAAGAVSQERHQFGWGGADLDAKIEVLRRLVVAGEAP